MISFTSRVKAFIKKAIILITLICFQNFLWRNLKRAGDKRVPAEAEKTRIICFSFCRAKKLVKHVIEQMFINKTCFEKKTAGNNDCDLSNLQSKNSLMFILLCISQSINVCRSKAKLRVQSFTLVLFLFFFVSPRKDFYGNSNDVETNDLCLAVQSHLIGISFSSNCVYSPKSPRFLFASTRVHWNELHLLLKLNLKKYATFINPLRTSTINLSFESLTSVSSIPRRFKLSNKTQFAKDSASVCFKCESIKKVRQLLIFRL